MTIDEKAHDLAISAVETLYDFTMRFPKNFTNENNEITFDFYNQYKTFYSDFLELLEQDL